MLSITNMLRSVAGPTCKIMPLRVAVVGDYLPKYLRLQNRTLTLSQRIYSNDDKRSKKEVPKPKNKVPSIQDCGTSNMMNDVPKLQPWQEETDKAKKKYTRTLLIGLAVFAMSLTGLSFLNLMHRPEPKKPKVDKKKQIIRDPLNSASIPKHVPYLLIGGGTASFSAFRAIKSSDPTAKVLVIANEPHLPYMRPPLSKEMWFNDDKKSIRDLMFKQWNGSERSLFYEPKDFYIDCNKLLGNENGGVAVASGWEVSEINVDKKEVKLDDGYTIKYDKCLIATGASPRVQPVFEAALKDEEVAEKVKVFRNIHDFEHVLSMFEDKATTAIIGGGFLGSELACALARIGKKDEKKIYQVFKEGGNMGKVLPEYLSRWTTNKVSDEGVEVIPNNEIIGCSKKGDHIILTLSNAGQLKVDNVIIAVGVQPNTQLAEKSGLEVDPDLGGFLVNTELQARTDVYIAGDCACFYDAKFGRRRVEHHDHAVVTGRLAGENMTGNSKPYLHQSMFWSDLGPDVGFEAIGLVDSSLPTVAVFARAGEGDSPKDASADGNKTQDIESPPASCDKHLTPEDKKETEVDARTTRKDLPRSGEDFGKGVIFYLKNDIVVGIVLWNVFNRMSIARQVLKEEKKYDDLNEVAKLFNIHEE